MIFGAVQPCCTQIMVYIAVSLNPFMGNQYKYALFSSYSYQFMKCAAVCGKRKRYLLINW